MCWTSCYNAFFSHCKCCNLESHITIFLLPYVFYHERFTIEYHLDFKIANILWVIEKVREFQQNIHFCFTDYTKAFEVGSTRNWKILKEMGNTRQTYLSSEKPVYRTKSSRIGHGTRDWFKTGKDLHQGSILSSYLFNLYAEDIMWNVRLDETQDGIKITERNINYVQRCKWHYPYGRKLRRNKDSLDKSERG